MPNQNPTELIQKAVAGDIRAFEQLIELFQGLVYSIAYRLTGSVNESEDIMQETFIRVWKNLQKYNSDLSAKSWVAKIATNLCLDYLKSAKHKIEKENESLDIAHHKLTNEQNPMLALEADELHQTVLTLANKLTPKQRAVFVLRDLEMLEVAEVCKILDMKETQVKSNLYHARIALRADLLNYYNYTAYEL
jgi:RNA polymerase sigma-70 factor (ECF subfamily)